MSTTKETSSEDEKFFFNFSFQLRAIKKKKKDSSILPVRNDHK